MDPADLQIEEYQKVGLDRFAGDGWPPGNTVPCSTLTDELGQCVQEYLNHKPTLQFNTAASTPEVHESPDLTMPGMKGAF